MFLFEGYLCPKIPREEGETICTHRLQLHLVDKSMTHGQRNSMFLIGTIWIAKRNAKFLIPYSLQFSSNVHSP